MSIDKNEVFISSPDTRYKIPEGVKITQLALIGSTGYCLSGRDISVLSFVDFKAYRGLSSILVKNWG